MRLPVAAARMASWWTTTQPWQRGPWYWASAFLLSAAFGFGIGLTIGAMMHGLPYLLPLLGVAVAACLARTLIEVQAELDYRKAHEPPAKPNDPAR